VVEMKQPNGFGVQFCAKPAKFMTKQKHICLARPKQKIIFLNLPVSDQKAVWPLKLIDSG